MLAGSRDFIHEAWRIKQQIGGAMRQAGIIAAACLYALDHHVERLAEDHANARHLAEGLAEIPGIELDPATVETNIVCSTCARTSAVELAATLKERGVLIGAFGPTRMRAVTHLDADRAGIDSALETLRRVLSWTSPVGLTNAGGVKVEGRRFCFCSSDATSLLRCMSITATGRSRSGSPPLR